MWSPEVELFLRQFGHNFATVGDRAGLSDARIAIMLGHSRGTRSCESTAG